MLLRCPHFLFEEIMDELLNEIKTRLLIEGEYNDSVLKALAFDVMEYLKNAGVPIAIINSSKAYGTISKGVADLWFDKNFSEIFKNMAIQLALSKGDE